MKTYKVFGKEWEIGESNFSETSFFSSDKYHFYATKKALNEIEKEGTAKYNSIIFSIYRYYIKGQVLLFLAKEEANFLIGDSYKGLIVQIRIADELERLPNRIDEIIKWIMGNLYLQSKEYGESIPLTDDLCFFSNSNDDRKLFFIKLLQDQNLIAGGPRPIQYDVFYPISITNIGWKYIEDNILNRNENTKDVFIAMSFNPAMDTAYEAIKAALDQAGKYKDIRIDKKPHNNEITGEIMYEIRRSKFVVADVTGQRPGVYFEAGYAMGKGIPVIWACRKDEEKLIHFDTRQYNHVLWSNEDELRTMLCDRIRGTIE